MASHRDETEPGPLLKPGEVAGIFRVDPATVVRWAKKRLLTVILTPGGQRRYRALEIQEWLDETLEPARTQLNLVAA